jgi:hypothetical protein
MKSETDGYCHIGRLENWFVFADTDRPPSRGVGEMRGIIAVGLLPEFWPLDQRDEPAKILIYVKVGAWRAKYTNYNWGIILMMLVSGRQ